MRSHQVLPKNAVFLPQITTEIDKNATFSKFEREIIFFLFASFSKHNL